MGDGEEHGVVKVADFGLARIYQAPLKPLSENGVRAHFSSVEFFMYIPCMTMLCLTFKS
jgi:hypothetical protein